MKAVQLLAQSHAKFVEVPKPALKPGYALVRAIRLSLCGSDIRWLHHMAPEAYPCPPGTTGHEMIGVVEAVDAPGSPIKVGDVALTLAPDHCAMAEYYLAPVENVLVLPPGKSIDELLQAQQLGTVLYACELLPDVKDKDVVVIGQGSAGLWFDMMLRKLGASRVIAIDLQAYRLKAGAMYGATDTIHNAQIDAIQALADLTNGRMADVVIEAAGEVETINMAVDLARDYGFILYFGVPRAQSFPYKMDIFFDKCLQAQAIVHATREPGHTSTKKALNMITSNEVNVTPILTHRFPFAQVLEAYELHRTQDEGAIKILIDMPVGK